MSECIPEEDPDSILCVKLKIFVAEGESASAAMRSAKNVVEDLCCSNVLSNFTAGQSADRKLAGNALL